MPILPSHTTFRRIQTDDPTKATLFLSLDLTSPTGETVPGSMEPVEVALTEAEQLTFAGLVDRGRQAYCDQKNTPTPTPEPPPQPE